ncbi:TolC family protein [Novosphingobium album (ex Liu et al. 2023)]|uniref:TolC family protein n=1 Tax=Novosphingobium album (ex Liu et al. 2023) TaxID=3031130 RepID=A0ABT5WVX7_9SPHN|nr:TolC family protein [Novosphingobium album (ex Liu et al. 2023)]MDE8654042.1 TolC family protein [Novosphingobium album (ex Liu et al. 2023)]
MRRLTAFLALAGAALPLASASAQSLDQVVAATFAHSPVLTAARAREDAAAAALDQARAERMPLATAQGQIATGYIDPQGFFGLSADDVAPRSAQATVELPLYTGGRVGAAVAQAKGGRALAALATQSAALDLRLQVVRAYTQALAAQEQLRSYDKLVEALAEAVRQAHLTFRAGAGTSTEVAQAEARKAEADAGLAGARGALASAMAQLATLSGGPVQPSGDLPPAPPVPATPDEAVDLATRHNPQVEQARKAADVARAGIAAARAEGLPTVGAFAEAASVRDQFFPGYKADSASVGLRARWTFFSGGRVSAKVNGAEAQARAADADALAAAQMVENQAVQAFAGVTSARAMLAAARARVSATEDALRGTRFEVKAGAKPQLALLDAEREAIAAQTARIEANGRLLVAAYTLRAITGMEEAP